MPEPTPFIPEPVLAFIILIISLAVLLAVALLCDARITGPSNALEACRPPPVKVNLYPVCDAVPPITILEFVASSNIGVIVLPSVVFVANLVM